ncbi:protein male-specific lethal-3 isoform X2 [Bradysia coprophila]|uniref:protein male-specific lethal-3 isoform X2 n=1 Tax=Bradysia coprophila TaxID=38358 RepID=UPI00187D802F|nr:protein male-specific lethal-3 isoform X2 [Bradysia coprophila]
MVSTRGIKYKFAVNERVLCYEPDPTKKKVLYDSKVIAIFDGKDRRGKKSKVEYLIHFQGWSSSWDRRVCEEFVLKDIDENRRLQRELADKAQLQIGAYLYRKERTKRSREMSSGSNSDSKGKIQKMAEEPSSLSNGLSIASIGNSEFVERLLAIKQEPGLEATPSIVENDNNRLFLHIGEKLRNFLEFDCAMITKMEKLVNLPAQIPVVTILESFVKHISIKALSCPTPVHALRKRSNNGKGDKREKDYEKLINSINLRKEVADGLRLYFDFTLKDHLLYGNEMEQANTLLSEDYLTNFTYIPSNRQFLDSLTIKQDSLGTPAGSEISEPAQINNVEIFDESRYLSKRRLRSHKKMEKEFLYEIGMTAPSSPMDCKFVSSTSYDIIPTTSNMVPSQGSKSKEILKSVMSWQLLQSDAPPKPSMIYGAIHLARLIVKLPEFLNSSAISDAKLKVLLSHLDVFMEFMESHKEWFSALNYRDVNMCSSPDYDTKENIIRIDMPMDNHVYAGHHGGARIKIER